MGFSYRIKALFRYRMFGSVTPFRFGWILFLTCFFLAVLLANTSWKNEAAWIGYMHETVVQTAVAGIQPGAAWKQILVWRMIPVLLFLLFGRKKIGVACSYVFVAWQGYALGLALAAMILRYGVSGGLIFGMMGVPHGPIYVLAYGCLFQKNLALLQRRKNKDEASGEINVRRQGGESVCSAGDLVGLGIILMLFLTGYFLECYVNVIFLNEMLNFLKKY